jgi:anaerobic selenocysteine-containing dehydrogenase
MNDWLEMNRRDFLAALGATYGGFACAWASPPSEFIEYAGAGQPGSTERFVNTLCPMCPGGCGLQVRVVHGCAVGVRGNNDHPINRGGLCSRASAVLQDLYNPDRLRFPLKRIGEPGSGKWEKVGWDTALDLITNKLRLIREGRGPQGLCIVSGRDRGVTHTAWQRFARAYGSPNLIDAYPEDNLGILPAVLATHGVRQRLGYDIAAASFVLSFSSGWLDSHWSAEQAARAFADFRRGRPGFRPQWIHVEPRYSLTAAKADEWLPIRPGTEGTLALGIAHVLIRERLYDREFVDQHGYGFEDWTDTHGQQRLGFRRMVLQDFSPAKVQALTGVAEGDIFRLGRQFGATRPAIALGYDGGGCGAQATYDRMAIHALNALVGSIDTPGGVNVFQELSLLEDSYDVDDIAVTGLAQPRVDGPPEKRRLTDNALDLLADAITSDQPYPIEGLILADADPAFSLAGGTQFAEALEQVPFVVALSGYHNDSTALADIVLPSLHSLHRWDFNIAHTLKGHPVVTLAQPVLPAPQGSRDPYEIVRALATRLSSSGAGALPWADSQEVVGAACREIFDSAKGAAFGPANEQNWAQLLESRGWRAPFATNFSTFQRDMLAGGGWTDPIYFHKEWDRIFRWPARQFAFSSAYLERSYEALPDVSGNGEQNGRRYLPNCRTEPPVQDPDRPFELYIYALPNLVGVASPNLPWLNDVAGAYMFEKWRTWVEINPRKAEQLSIHDGDAVEVRTARGTLTLPAKLHAGVMPEVIAIPFGFGHKNGGRWCEGVGENPNQLLEPHRDSLTGTDLWTSTRAQIRKA